jgi:spermidine synthase
MKEELRNLTSQTKQINDDVVEIDNAIVKATEKYFEEINAVKGKIGALRTQLLLVLMGLNSLAAKE